MKKGMIFNKKKKVTEESDIRRILHNTMRNPIIDKKLKEKKINSSIQKSVKFIFENKSYPIPFNGVRC